MEPAYYNNNVSITSLSTRPQHQTSTIRTTSPTAINLPTDSPTTKLPHTYSPTPPSSTTSTLTKEEHTVQSVTATHLWCRLGRLAQLNGSGASWYSCCSGLAAGYRSWWISAVTSVTSAATAELCVTGTVLPAAPEEWWPVHDIFWLNSLEG